MLHEYSTYRQNIIRSYHQASAKLKNLKHTSALHASVGPSSESLYTDYFYTPEKKKKCLVHISGVHGVEGYLGSNIQNQILQRIAQDEVFRSSISDDLQIVIVHAVNPFGMSWYHRTNEENVDLNRNSMSNYDIENKLFGKWEPLMSSRSDLMLKLQFLKLIPSILIHGKDKLFRAIAKGQSQFPNSLFYAGNKLQFELSSLLSHLQPIIDADAELFVLDVHTGLGARAQESLLLDGFDNDLDVLFFENKFSTKVIQPLITPGYYRAEGTLSLLLKRNWGTKNVHHIFQEFGTYDFKFVMRQLIRDQHMQTRSSQEMLETYFPKDDQWLNTCSQAGLLRFTQLVQK